MFFTEVAEVVEGTCKLYYYFVFVIIVTIICLFCRACWRDLPTLLFIVMLFVAAVG